MWYDGKKPYASKQTNQPKPPASCDERIGCIDSDRVIFIENLYAACIFSTNSYAYVLSMSGPLSKTKGKKLGSI